MTGWNDIAKAGRSLTKDVDGDGKTDIWGLLSDTDASWTNLSAAYDAASGNWDAGKLQAGFERWHDYLSRSHIMPPLQHQLAASQFIYGKAGMLIGSSKKRLTLEKYIGGKFDLAVAPLPKTERDEDLVPFVSGLAVMNASGDAAKGAWSCIRFMLEDAVQSKLIREASLIPARTDMTERLVRENGGSGRELALLQMSDRLAVKFPREDDLQEWERYASMQDWLETFPNVTEEELLAKFDELMKKEGGK